MESAFLALRGAWRGMIDSAIQAKRPFQQDADKCMMFFNGSFDLVWDGTAADGYQFVGMKKIKRPPIVMSYNKVAEGTQIFGPNLYAKNPTCKVSPRKPPELPPEAFGDQSDPQTQAMSAPIFKELSEQQLIDAVRSSLIGGRLNYLPTAINLKENSRQSIDEGIIKGMGLLWAYMLRPAGGGKLSMLEYDTVDNLFVDADYNNLDKAKVIYKRCVEPVWQVEAEHGIPFGTLKANAESHSSASQASLNPGETSGGVNSARGKTNDLLTYYKIWSKMGLGGMLKGANDDAREADRFGQYVYMEVCEGCEYFLNCPPAIWENEDEMRRRFQWETPFWADEPTTNGWPFTPFIFHRVPNRTWPMSHFHPAMGELMFLNWAYSFLISAIQTSSRDFIAIAGSAANELEQKIKDGDHLTVLTLESVMNKSIEEVVQFLQHPQINKDIFTIIQAVEASFEKRTGLNELMYGLQDTQDRSATETKVKQEFVNVRPDDMKTRVEDAMTEAFRKLALMERWHQTGEDIAKCYGPTIGKLWETHVATADIREVIHALEYRVEAGSTGKPNPDKDKDDANAMMQSLFQPMMQYATASGDVDPINAIMQFYLKAMNMPHEAVKLKPPQPPPPPVPDPPKYAISLKGEDVMTLGLDTAVRAEFGEKGPAPAAAHPVVQQMAQDEAIHQQQMDHNAEKNALDIKIKKSQAAAAKNGSGK